MLVQICCHMRSLDKYHSEVNLTAYSWMLICSMWRGMKIVECKHRNVTGHSASASSPSSHLLTSSRKLLDAKLMRRRVDFGNEISWQLLDSCLLLSIVFYSDLQTHKKQCCIEKKHKDFTFKTQHTLRCESWGFMCSVSLHCEYE